MLLNFVRYLKRPTLEMASGFLNLRQSTMAAASAARMALCGQFGFSEIGSLASADAGAPLLHKFYENELFWRRSSRLT